MILIRGDGLAVSHCPLLAAHDLQFGPSTERERTDAGRTGVRSGRNDNSMQCRKNAEAQKVPQMLKLALTYAQGPHCPHKKCHLSFTRGVDGQMGLPYNPAR